MERIPQLMGATGCMAERKRTRGDSIRANKRAQMFLSGVQLWGPGSAVGWQICHQAARFVAPMLLIQGEYCVATWREEARGSFES